MDDVFSLEEVLHFGGTIVVGRHDGFFEGEAGDVSVEECEFEDEAFIGVVDECLEVEVLAKDSTFLRRGLFR